MHMDLTLSAAVAPSCAESEGPAVMTDSRTSKLEISAREFSGPSKLPSLSQSIWVGLIVGSWEHKGLELEAFISGSQRRTDMEKGHITFMATSPPLSLSKARFLSEESQGCRVFKFSEGRVAFLSGRARDFGDSPAQELSRSANHED